jgi:uncharacterized membrane protein YeaQ/YmgE (transglycosylase-associated protein family)
LSLVGRKDFPMVGNIIGAIILGILAGYLARAFLPGKQQMGFVMTVALGIAGAVAGFYIFEGLFGWGDTDKFDLGGLPGAVIGAMILLFLYERFVGSSTPTTAPVEPAARAERGRRREERRRERQG